MMFKPPRDQRVIRFIPDGEARIIGRQIAGQYSETFKMLAEAEKLEQTSGMQNFAPTRPNYVAPTPDAVDATRSPVQAPRSQDANPAANDNKTRVTERGVQPTQPNASSLRQ